METAVRHELGRGTTVVWVIYLSDFHDFCIYKTTILLATAGLDEPLPSASEEELAQDKTRVVAFDLFPGDDQGSYECKLDVLGQWYVDGNVDGIEFYRDSDGVYGLFLDLLTH